VLNLAGLHSLQGMLQGWGTDYSLPGRHFAKLMSWNEDLTMQLPIPHDITDCAS